MRVHLRAALSLVTVVLVAAGCSDPNPSPPPLPGTIAATASATSSPPAAPTPPSASSTPTPTPAAASAADRAAGQKAVTVFVGALNDAAAARSDAPLEGTWQQSCIWCATVIQPIQMASFAEDWRLTPARVTGARITYWKPGISGQLLYRVTMSVSALKLVDDNGTTQRSTAAVRAGSFSFAAQEMGGRWQVVQGVHGDIAVPSP